jgi:hypothetical protein
VSVLHARAGDRTRVDLMVLRPDMGQVGARDEIDGVRI